MKKKTLSLILVMMLLMGILNGCGSTETTAAANNDATAEAADAAENTEAAEQADAGSGADALFAGGTGTEDDPWQVATAEQLNCIRDDLTGHYALVDDIDLSGYENWIPIGSFQPLSDAPEDQEVPHPDYAFTGSFDGAGHTITGLPLPPAVGDYGICRERRFSSQGRV